MERIKVPGLWDDGNIFSIAGKASGALRRSGQAQQADELWTRVRAAADYDAAIQVVMEYAEDLEGGA